jgi:arylsulfatase A-like enzyme
VSEVRRHHVRAYKREDGRIIRDYMRGRGLAKDSRATKVPAYFEPEPEDFELNLYKEAVDKLTEDYDERQKEIERWYKDEFDTATEQYQEDRAVENTRKDLAEKYYDEINNLDENYRKSIDYIDRQFGEGKYKEEGK